MLLVVEGSVCLTLWNNPRKPLENCYGLMTPVDKRHIYTHAASTGTEIITQGECNRIVRVNDLEYAFIQRRLECVTVEVIYRLVSLKLARMSFLFLTQAIVSERSRHTLNPSTQQFRRSARSNADKYKMRIIIHYRGIRSSKMIRRKKESARCFVQYRKKSI
jgi:hypothetical protein